MNQTAIELPGKRGATAASWTDKNPRVLVRHIIERHPNADDAEICRHVRRALNTRAWLDFADAFVDHTTRNCLLALRAEDRRDSGGVVGGVCLSESVVPITPTPVVLPPRKTDAEQAVARSTRVEEAKRKILRVAILELQSPDGRLYGVLPIADFIKLGDRQAQFGRSLIRRGHKPTELLGSATTNEELSGAVNV